MKYKTRKRLFILFTLLFFISIGPMILYTQGFRLDVNNFTLTKTGGLDLGVSNSNSQVYLNGKFQRETNFLFRNAVFRNIIPGTYDISVEKEGFNTWKKTTVVEEGQVSKFPSIRLFPLEFDKGVLARDMNNIYVSPEGRYSIIEQESTETTAGSATTQLIYFDLEVRLPINFLTLGEDEILKEVAWYDRTNNFALVLESEEQESLFIGSGNEPLNLTNWSEFINSSYRAAFAEENIIIPTESNSTIYVAKKQNDETFTIDRIDLDSRTIRPNIIDGLLGFKIIGEEIFYLNELGSIEKMNLTERVSTKITPTAISQPSLEGTEIIVRNDREAIAIINNGSLFLWQNNKPLEKIGDNIKEASFSSDSVKLLYRTDNAAYIYWMKEVFGPPKRALGDKIEIKQPNIQNVHWIASESNHIAIQTIDKIIFTELDRRSTVNNAVYNIQTDSNLFKISLQRQEIYTIIPETNNFVYLNFNK